MVAVIIGLEILINRMHFGRRRINNQMPIKRGHEKLLTFVVEASEKLKIKPFMKDQENLVEDNVRKSMQII